jgi:hypothetical protein
MAAAAHLQRRKQLSYQRRYRGGMVMAWRDNDNPANENNGCYRKQYARTRVCAARRRIMTRGVVAAWQRGGEIIRRHRQASAGT